MSIEKEKITIKDITIIVGALIPAVTVGIIVGRFSNRLTNIETRTSLLESKITEINQINLHLQKIDDNLGFIAEKLKGVDVVNR
jgi:uncharacterized coiled-coil protein SlyX